MYFLSLWWVIVLLLFYQEGLLFIPNTSGRDYSTSFVSGSSEVDEKVVSHPSALQQARALNAPLAKVANDGNVENYHFWDEHETLIQSAFEEYGKLHKDLYRWNDKFIEKYLDSNLKLAFEKKSFHLLSKLVQETEVKGVYSIQIFNLEFTNNFLEELKHYEASGVPIRRPNSMNRHGIILSTIGFQNFLSDITNKILKVLARYMLREYANPQDLEEYYAFTVKYKPGMDRNLTSHTDHSTVTVNICLENAQNETALFFFHREEEQKWLYSDDNSDKERTFVPLSTPGMALFHLGQHKHGIVNVQGERTQLVIWMYGQNGYVRIAPYRESEIVPQEWSSDDDFDVLGKKNITRGDDEF